MKMVTLQIHRPSMTWHNIGRTRKTLTACLVVSTTILMYMNHMMQQIHCKIRAQVLRLLPVWVCNQTV